MDEIKNIYDMPRIILISALLNILGNTIKITFNIKSKYIIWILLFISIVINFVFFGIGFESFLLAFISFSFSVSSYDLIKYGNKIRKNK